MSKIKKLTKQKFDEIIKQNLLEDGFDSTSFSYQLSGKFYDTYYSKASFDQFVADMRANYPEHNRKYAGDPNVTHNKGGQGGELVEKKGRYGYVPPKMASVASSSRFCYLALKDGTDVLLPDRVVKKEEVEFEKECQIWKDSSTAPQLDAYISDERIDYYIEAKCHEIFDVHKIEFKNKYWNIFEADNSFKKAIVGVEKGKEKFVLARTVFGLSDKQTRFDVKQFICHLLGIAQQSKGKNAKLVYLFFKPLAKEEAISKEIDLIFAELKEEIKAIFSCSIIREFCEENQIELEAIAEESSVMEKLNKMNVRNILHD